MPGKRRQGEFDRLIRSVTRQTATVLTHLVLRFEPTGDGHVGVLQELLVVAVLFPRWLVLRRVEDGQEFVFLAAHRRGEDAVAEEVVHEALGAALSSPVLGHDARAGDCEMDVGEGNETSQAPSDPRS